MSITTARLNTLRTAAVAIVIVTIVTVLPDCANAIAAAGDQTGIGAVVLIPLVAVIAAFKSRCAFRQIPTQYPITTTSEHTVAEAGILVVVVAIVAGLTGIDASVATGFTLAALTAAIPGFFVAIVAFLKALFARG